MADAVPPHEAAFEAQMAYMIDSIRAGSLAPACLAEGLIDDRERDECFRESGQYKKAEMLLGHVKRSIKGNRTNFDKFVAILRRTGHSTQADKLTIPIETASDDNAAISKQSRKVETEDGVAKPKRRAETDEGGDYDEIPKFPMKLIHVIQNECEPLKPSEDQYEAVTDFADEVKVVIQSCNDAEYFAALEAIEPLPRFNKPVRYPNDENFTIVVGTFAGKNAAIVRTKQGNECREDLKTILPRFKNAKMLLGVGVCMGIKHKLGDVLVGKKIWLQEKIKVRQGKLELDGTCREAKQTVANVFCDTTAGWNQFECTDVPKGIGAKARVSEVFCGYILSSPGLWDDPDIKDGLECETLPLIGAEMEGWVLFKYIDENKDFEFPKIESIIIKGICDYGDGTKDKVWQLTAAKAAVDYARFKLKNAF